MEGIDIIRVWVKTSRTKNLRTRLVFYITFMVNAFLAGLFLTHGRYDLIYASSPPLFVGGAAVWLSRIKRTPLVFEVRDLWPEFAVALGEIQDQKSIKLATKLEKLCYRSASRIIVVTQGIYDRLINTRNTCRINLFSYRMALIPSYLLLTQNTETLPANI